MFEPAGFVLTLTTLLLAATSTLSQNLTASQPSTLLNPILASENYTLDLNAQGDRKYTCLAPSGPQVKNWPKISECLNLLIRFPSNGMDQDFLPRAQGGYVPSYATFGKCRVSLEYTESSVQQDRTSWAMFLSAASNLAFLCRKGEERTGGMVIIGEQGLLSVKISKNRDGPGDEVPQPYPGEESEGSGVVEAGVVLANGSSATS